MNDKFDELAKNMAQSTTRRRALKKFGVGLAGIGLGALGLTNKASAAKRCTSDAECPQNHVCEYVAAAGGYICVRLRGHCC